ncbi:MAG TPA: YwaF family protein [Candidatus Izemoplasmatales bacterium]|nr:YwaF family protein [Bacillota bacterium]HRY77359.1 YwaF family protein [Candidatus Izemoplasmatales bacterium]
METESAKIGQTGVGFMGNFGTKHLTGLLWVFSTIAVVLTVLLWIKKKYHKGEGFDRKVIAGAALFIWAWEIVKTIYIFNSTDYGPVGHYTAYMLPFHICSMGLYAFWILGFRPGKVADFIKPFAFAIMLLVTMIILIIPDSSGILGDEYVADWSWQIKNILPYQSFSYHGTLVFVPLYMVLSGYYRPKIADFWKSEVTLLVVAVIAFVLNKLLHVTDFMMLEFGWGNPFAYLIEDQYGLYLLLLAGITTLGSALVLGIAQGLSALGSRRRQRKTT